MNTVAMNVKTDPQTKDQIRRAAEQLGLSLSSFVVLVSKQAALSPQIVLRNAPTLAEQINADLKSGTNINEFKNEDAFFNHLDSLSVR